MNTSRYIVARLLLAFGVHRKIKRLTEAADELHLAMQAEEILGEELWSGVEKIDDLNVEYWSLRKLKMENASLESAIADADVLLNSSHEERNAILAQTSQESQDLIVERKDYVADHAALVVQRDQTIEEGKLLRRKIEASKTKVQVLEAEEANESGAQGDAAQQSLSAEQISEEGKNMDTYIREFKNLKAEREAIAISLNELAVKFKEIDDKVGQVRKRLRAEASSVYQNISKANQGVSKLSANMNAQNIEMKLHYTMIGRYISHNPCADLLTKPLKKSDLRLITQIQTLRASIALNHKLVSLADF